MGVAIGNQDKINFGSARKSDLTTAFTAGLGKYLQTGSRFVDATEKVNSFTGLKQLNAGGNLIRGVGAALSSNLANKIEDGSSNFNWGGIAASALTSQVPTPKPTGNPLTDFTVSFTQNLITSAMSASLRDAVSGNGNTNYGLLAANAFGSALGNAIVSANLEEPRFKGTINTTKLDASVARVSQELSDPGIPIQDGNNARVAQKAEENTQAALATKQNTDEQVVNAKQVERDNRATVNLLPEFDYRFNLAEGLDDAFATYLAQNRTPLLPPHSGIDALYSGLAPCVFHDAIMPETTSGLQLLGDYAFMLLTSQ